MFVLLMIASYNNVNLANATLPVVTGFQQANVC